MTLATDAIAPPSADTADIYFGIDVPFMRHIGLEPLSLDLHNARTRLVAQPWLVNSRGDVHGGSLMSALDFTLSAAARAHEPLRIGAATIDMSTHFLNVGRGDLTLVGRCIKRGKSIAFCEGEAVDAAGTVIVVARATFKLIRRD